MNKKGLSIVVVIVLLVSVILISFWNFGNVNAQNLMKGITPNKVVEETLPDDFIGATSDFSISLFKKLVSQDKNSLLSPVSAALALGMTANGADEKTREQFGKLLGGGTISIDDLNKYYHSLSSIIQNNSINKIKLANSIWYRDDKSLTVNPHFLQINADYFQASAYKADFNSEATVKDINNWVKKNTGGMIDKIIDRVNADTIMYLFNAVLFEAEWDTVYKKNDINKGNFTRADGQTISTDFMHSFESYLESDSAKGFIKPYKGNRYSLVAILPDEGTSVEEYIRALDGKSFMNFVNSKSNSTASISIPKFKYKYEISLVKSLKLMGLTAAFDSNAANFSKMATSSEGNIYIGDVFHKTFIQVDELGTKAGAVTKVEMRSGSAMVEDKKVILDRPFIYAIVENETKLPVFIGTVMDLQKNNFS